MSKPGRHPRGRQHSAPEVVGLHRRRGDTAPCGLCGSSDTPLTKTHIPPQCAGNDAGVQRHYLLSVTEDGEQKLVRSTKRRRGGLYVYGLCAACNGAAGQWDSAYKALADALRPLWVAEALAIPDNRLTMPDIDIHPSRVARSVLMGLFGLNHHLWERHPELAAALLVGAEGIALPADLRLSLALSRGRSGRLVGPVHTRQIFGSPTGRVLALLTDAAVYFPPLAWQLAAPASDLLDQQGWVDVGDWLSMPTTESRNLRRLAASLPLVFEPTQDPALAKTLLHLFSDNITPIVETTGLGL